MRRWLALTTAGVVAAGGCAPFGPGSKPGRPVGQGSKPANDRPGDAVSPNAPDVLAGFVVAPDGRKARDVSVEYTEANGADAGAPVEVRTDDAGYFRIERLAPNRMYRLTAKAAQDGVPLGGRAYAQTGVAQSQRVTIQLFENQTFGAAQAGDAATGGGMPKPADMPLPKPAATFGPHDLNIPGRASADPVPVDPLPVPATPPAGPPSLTAVAPPTPEPDRPPPLTALPRPDARTPSPSPYQPPLAVIPPLLGPPAGSRKPPARAANEFVLVDARGADREYPAGGKWVLLDFMSSTCVPCAKSVPVLNALQDRLAGKGVEVVGVLCDDAPLRDRRDLAATYARKHKLDYPLLTEPADTPGALSARFGVTKWPTLVLLDGNGNVAWKGHPANAAEVERLVR